MTDAIDREIWVEFLFHNKIRDRKEGLGTWNDKPPLFYAGSAQLTGKLAAGRAVITLPCIRATKCSASLDAYVDTLIHIITQCQPTGPYLLAGYCSEGYTVYEIARRLTASGREVGLLALIECTAPNISGWIKLARKLMLCAACPEEFVLHAGRRFKVAKERAFGSGAPKDKKASNLDLYIEKWVKLFQGYWDELAQGRVPYSGPLVLLFGRRSTSRFFPTWGWRRSARGKLEVRVVSGDHFTLLDDESLARDLSLCIDKSLAQLPRAECVVSLASGPMDRALNPALQPGQGQ